MKVAFVGLGVMGYPMAGHLAAGHEMSVFNRSPEKARRWVAQHGGRVGASVSETAAGCEFIILCVGNDDDVRGVVAEALPAMAEGGVIVDHTTTSAKLAREMAQQATAMGRGFVDAPVSGGQAGAEKGQLAVMAGGGEAAFVRAEPVMRVYSKAITRMGEAGTGQLAKMVNQICIAGVVQGLAEAVHFTKRSGLDPQLVYDAISKGAAQSWQMDNRWATMVEGRFDFGFAVDWMRKDLGLVLEEAAANGAKLEMTQLIDRFYAEIQEMGGRRWDTSSLAARLER
jgi:3-hydroxyisobutyrate dehydrogenase